MPHANWHHQKVRQYEHTMYCTYQQQSTGKKKLMGYLDDNLNKTS